jgi:bidirectional [NiFe] hydrogenase diaphorase subunit
MNTNRGFGNEGNVAAKTLTIDGQLVSARSGETILQAARDADIAIPTLCHFDGLSDVGACRLCLVEVEGQPKLLASCVTAVAEGMVVHTNTARLREYRRMILELLFAERNHVCSVCVVNGHCELQDLAVGQGMDHVRFDYQFPRLSADLSHQQFGMDHNRCVMCTRCVRVCDEIEGVHTWDVMGRGAGVRVITDMNQPWGKSDTCTSCGKCVQVCPTGALFPQGATVGSVRKDHQRIELLVAAREHHQWPA